MKRVLLACLCAIFFSQLFPGNAVADFKVIWSAEYPQGYWFYKLCYTSDTILTFFTKRDENGFYLKKLTYCSGKSLNEDLLRWSDNIQFETISVIDNRIFFIAIDSAGEKCSLTCTDMNLEIKWQTNVTVKKSNDPMFVDLYSDYVVFNSDDITYVFDIDNGELLMERNSKYIGNSAYNGCVLSLSDKLFFSDPYSKEVVWSYNPPGYRYECFGIKNGFVMVTAYLNPNTLDSRAIVLDAQTGKQLWSIDYNYPVYNMSFVANLLVVTSRDEHKCKYLDAFETNSWAYVWTTMIGNWKVWYTSDNIYTETDQCTAYILYRIDIITGKKDYENMIFFSTPSNASNNIIFQANRIIVADNYSKMISCYIDETF